MKTLKKNKFINYINELSTYKKVAIIGYLFILLILFYGFIYNDILETTRMGISFWEQLFVGRIRFFYNNFVEMNPFAYTKQVQGVYDFPIYIAFAIWDFPLYLLYKFAGVDVFNNVLCIMWIKTLLLLFTVLLMKAMFDLCKAVGLSDSDSSLALLLFITSDFYMTSIALMCAYDIIPLYFSIIGVKAYIEDDMKKFVGMFMLAIPLKFFALLLFIPLLVLKEKNVIKIAVSTFLSVLPIIVFRILIPCSGNGTGIRLSDAAVSTDLSHLALYYVIRYYSEMALGRIYYFLLCYGVFVLICYFIKSDRSDNNKRWTIYVALMSYIILFVTCYSHPYWLIIMMPFVAIIMVINKEYLHISLLLEWVFSLGLILAQIFEFSWCYGNGPAAGSFWGKIFGQPGIYYSYNVFTILQNSLGLDTAESIVIAARGIGSTVFVGAIVSFMIISALSISNRHLPFWNKTEKAVDWIMCGRLVSCVVIALMPIYMHLMTV